MGEIKRTDLVAYFAGFIDGEGSFVVQNRTDIVKGKIYKSWTPSITVYNRCPYPIRAIAEYFGYSVKERIDPVSGAIGYITSSCRSKVADVINSILPYIRSKRPQAELMLNLCNRMKTSNRKVGMTESEKMERAAIRDEVRRLNGRFTTKIDMGKSSYQSISKPATSSDSDLAYMAGFFDGEGTICINHHKSFNTKYNKTYEGWELNIVIGNNCGEPMKLFSERFGGIVKYKPIKNRCSYIWRSNGPSAKKVLESLLPYLLVKKDQSIVAIEFQKRVESIHGKRRCALPDEEKAIRSSMKNEIRRLNGLCNTRSQRAYTRGVYK